MNKVFGKILIVFFSTIIIWFWLWEFSIINNKKKKPNKNLESAARNTTRL